MSTVSLRFAHHRTVLCMVIVDVQAVYVALDTEIMRVRKWAGDMDIQSPIIVDRFNAIAKRHGVIDEDAQQPREIPLRLWSTVKERYRRSLPQKETTLNSIARSHSFGNSVLQPIRGSSITRSREYHHRARW